MPCPTCDHTLECVISPADPPLIGALIIKHCPRCGTMVTGTQVYVPKLVERCRQLEKSYVSCDEYPPLTKDWRRIGLAEAINLPDARPKEA